jgi:hypothetical protein
MPGLGANKFNCRNNEGNGTSTKQVKNQKIRKVVGRRESMAICLGLEVARRVL